MNCSVCYAFLREKNRCGGCRSADCARGVSITRCRIKNCPIPGDKFCSTQCEQFPCDRLRNLDKRYRLKYGMSMLENLAKIENEGIRKFLKSEKTRWICGGCGGKLCVHYRECPSCGKKWH